MTQTPIPIPQYWLTGSHRPERRGDHASIMTLYSGTAREAAWKYINHIYPDITIDDLSKRATKVTLIDSQRGPMVVHRYHVRRLDGPLGTFYVVAWRDRDYEALKRRQRREAGQR